MITVCMSKAHNPRKDEKSADLMDIDEEKTISKSKSESVWRQLRSTIIKTKEKSSVQETNPNKELNR